MQVSEKIKNLESQLAKIRGYLNQDKAYERFIHSSRIGWEACLTELNMQAAYRNMLYKLLKVIQMDKSSWAQYAENLPHNREKFLAYANAYSPLEEECKQELVSQAKFVSKLLAELLEMQLPTMSEKDMKDRIANAEVAMINVKNEPDNPALQDSILRAKVLRAALRKSGSLE